MNIFIATYGSLGDVQPYIALGSKLTEAGHNVTLGTSERFRNFVEEHGLQFGRMSDDLLALIGTESGREMLEKTTDIFGAVKQVFKFAKQVKPMHGRVMRDTWEISLSCQPDFILYHPKSVAAPHIAEKLNVGQALATPIPITVPTSERPFFMLRDMKLGGWFNRMSYALINSLSGSYYKKLIDDFRQEIGLPKWRGSNPFKTIRGDDIPVLHGYSKHVLPHPTDWPSNAYTTGYWFLERKDDWVPPQQLQEFIEAGEEAVYVGFGSMAGRDPKRLTKIVIEALKISGQRGIIASGWGGLVKEELPDSIICIENAPHDWLFPQVAAVVHHGGAGTTAACLRAGKPSIIVPFFGDQPFWGRQVASLGAAPQPLPQKSLTAEKLADAITHAVNDSEMQQQAAKISEKIQSEDGRGTALTIIENLLIQYTSHQFQ